MPEERDFEEAGEAGEAEGAEDDDEQEHSEDLENGDVAVAADATPRRPLLDRGRYISTREAAELLGVNRATVINWSRQGKFGGVQYGVRGIYRFDRQELLDFITRHRIPYPDDAEAMGDAAEA